MSLKHLSKGSSQPPKVEGKLRLYSNKFCQYAERVRLILLVKNIPHDIVNVHLVKKPDWIFELNSLGMVPILDTSSEIITESLVICDYLDQKYPEPPLYPRDEHKRNEDKQLIKKFDSLSLSYSKVAYSQQTIKDVLPEVQVFENELRKRGLFFGGDKPSMVDYVFWPWGERAGVLGLIHQEDLPSRDEFPALYAWCEAMRGRSEVQQTVTSLERLYKIQKQYLESLEEADFDSI